MSTPTNQRPRAPDNSKLPELNPNVEGQQSGEQMPGGKSKLAKSPRETQAVHESEDKDQNEPREVSRSH